MKLFVLESLKYRTTAIPFLSFILCGCVANTTLTTFEYKPQADACKIAPVSIYVNRNESVARFYLSRLNEVYSTIANSGLFISTNPQSHSTIVIDANLNRGTYDSAVNTANHFFSAATLFIVPSKVSNFNELSVSVYEHGQLLRTFNYKEDYEDTLSIFSSPGDVEFRSIKNITNRFLEDLDRSRILPCVGPDLPNQT